MTTSSEFEFDGHTGTVVVRVWRGDEPARFIALLAHGYGEHAGRYGHVADRLVGIGAAVYAPDHAGHGRSAGEPAQVFDMDDLAGDLHVVAEQARADHPDVPEVLIGHSMGGLVATRYAQTYRDELTALVLSGPAVGINEGLAFLLELDPIPEVPIDPAILSRDPAVGEAYAADPLVYHGAFRKETLQAFVKGIEAVAFDPGLGDLPTLWIHGSDDQLVPYAPTAHAMEHLRGSTFEHRAYEGAAHEVFNETNRDEVLDDVVGFIERQLA
jgi:alpha-beta hydrolase superfamily lysophospholipase